MSYMNVISWIVGMIEYLHNILGALVVQWHLGVLVHPYGPRNRRDSINSSKFSHVTYTVIT